MSNGMASNGCQVEVERIDDRPRQRTNENLAKSVELCTSYVHECSGKCFFFFILIFYSEREERAKRKRNAACFDFNTQHTNTHTHSVGIELPPLPVRMYA